MPLQRLKRGIAGSKRKRWLAAKALETNFFDPGNAMESHAGREKIRNKFHYQFEREVSWTNLGKRTFGRVNGGLAFQGFQEEAGNAVPL